METALTLLQLNGLLQQWSDHKIVPGQRISATVRRQMDRADIIVFLFSPDFIGSTECRKEWDYASTLEQSGKMIFRIPIVVRDCAWKDMLGSDDVKALPNDGRPVSDFHSTDKAWMEVYEGMKAVITSWRTTFTPKEDFLRHFNQTDFISEHDIRLQDIFVFLRLTYNKDNESDDLFHGTTISTQGELLASKHTLIYGQEKSGKTALAKQLYLSLIDESQPVLFIDSEQTGPGKRRDILFRDAYHTQFYGDYSLWVKQDNKTLILDDMTSSPRLLDIVVLAKSVFDRIIITVPSDVLYAFFTDEPRLAEFRQMKIQPLTRSQQETLIRKRLAIFADTQAVTDAFVDQVENRVNSIIISNNIVPRYPFYVLSILQTYEAFMPSNISITSYGHCYYVLIIAHIMRSGISKADSDFNTCFNFAGHLAFEIHQHRASDSVSLFDFGAFLAKYKSQFIIGNSIINRLQDDSYGLITKSGTFRTEYMYYYFLAKFLSDNNEVGQQVISEMCESSYREDHYLTLLFIIHHTRSSSVIDDILIRTKCTLDSVYPAVLNSDETKQYMSILEKLPENILSENSVEESREIERANQDAVDNNTTDTHDHIQEPEDVELVNDVYRILKNNKIMGQVLRNNFGNLEKLKIEEIVEVIADSGLRLINHLLEQIEDEEGITQFAAYIRSRNPDWDISKVKQMLQFLSFIWTAVNVDQIVDAINIPEIKESVNIVVSRRSTPAYDLIGYFSQLGGANGLTKTERDNLVYLLNTHRDNIFVRSVLSLGTQQYMNTHRSNTMIEQSICDLLKIEYRPLRLRGH